MACNKPDCCGGNCGSPQGCICPPTSELTCQNQNCPRKSKTVNEATGTTKQLLQE